MSTNDDGSELSSKAVKKLARQYQQDHPGVPYPVARRAVLGTWRPLTALISEIDGQRLRINLEAHSEAGDGPHVGVFGNTGSGKSNLLTLMAQSIRREPPSRGAELIAVGDLDLLFEGSSLAESCDKVIGQSEVMALLDEVESTRVAQFRERDWSVNPVNRPDALPAVVILLDEDKKVVGDAPSAARRGLERMLRLGRALDVHVVLAGPPFARMRAQWTPPWLKPLLPNVIELQGRQSDDEGANSWTGRWRRDGGRDPVDLAIPFAAVP